MKHMKSGVCILLMASSLFLSGFDFHFSTSKTYNVNTDTGVVLQFEIDTTDHFDMTLNSPFAFTKGGEELGQAICMEEEEFDSQLQIFEQADNTQLLDSGEKDGNTYYFFSAYNEEGDYTEYDYFIQLDDSAISVVLGTVDSEENIRECFERLKVSILSQPETASAESETALEESETASEETETASAESETEGNVSTDTITLGDTSVSYDVPAGYEWISYEEETEQFSEDDTYCSRYYSTTDLDNYISVYVELMSPALWESEDDYFDSICSGYDYADYENLSISDIAEVENSLGSAKFIELSYEEDGNSYTYVNAIQMIGQTAFTVSFSSYDGHEIPFEDIHAFLNLKDAL